MDFFSYYLCIMTFYVYSEASISKDLDHSPIGVSETRNPADKSSQEDRTTSLQVSPKLSTKAETTTKSTGVVDTVKTSITTPYYSRLQTTVDTDIITFKDGKYVVSFYKDQTDTEVTCQFINFAWKDHFTAEASFYSCRSGGCGFGNWSFFKHFTENTRPSQFTISWTVSSDHDFDAITCYRITKDNTCISKTKGFVRAGTTLRKQGDGKISGATLRQQGTNKEETNSLPDSTKAPSAITTAASNGDSVTLSWLAAAASAVIVICCWC